MQRQQQPQQYVQLNGKRVTSFYDGLDSGAEASDAAEEQLVQPSLLTMHHYAPQGAAGSAKHARNGSLPQVLYADDSDAAEQQSPAADLASPNTAASRAQLHQFNVNATGGGSYDSDSAVHDAYAEEMRGLAAADSRATLRQLLADFDAQLHQRRT